LAAVLIIPMLATLALTIDVGFIAETTMELQNAADPAALAAAEQLPPYYVEYYSPGSSQYSSTTVSSAQTAAALFAKNYASFHRAGETTSLVLDTTNDFVLGYQDNSTPFTTTEPTNTFPNTVQVTLRLNGGEATNPQLGLFFAPALGLSQLTVTATARATIYNGDISGFSGADAKLLPVTLDQEVWQQFLLTGQGNLPDFNFSAPTSDAPGNAPSPAVANAPQIQVVPDANGRPGGWNYLSLDSSANSNDNYKSWFQNGLSASNLTALETTSWTPHPLPLPAQPSDPTQAYYFWKGSPGIRAPSEPFPAAGSVRILPLYRHVPVSQSGAGNYIAYDANEGQWDGNAGNGQNAWFNIVQFVGVVVSDSSNNALNVQPCALIDPNLVLSNLNPAGKPSSADQLQTAFSAPKLTY
jgi:hypothetical protein